MSYSGNHRSGARCSGSGAKKTVSQQIVSLFFRVDGNFVSLNQTGATPGVQIV